MQTGKFQFVELGKAFHQIGDRLAETLDQFFLGGARVFNRVVQQRGHNGHGVHLPFGERPGNGQGVRNVGFARIAALATMTAFAEDERLLNPRQISSGEVIQTINEYPVRRVIRPEGRGQFRRVRVGVQGGAGFRIHGRPLASRLNYWRSIKPADDSTLPRRPDPHRFRAGQ